MYYIYGSVRAIPTYKVYRLYDTDSMIESIDSMIIESTDSMILITNQYGQLQAHSTISGDHAHNGIHVLLCISI